jgi:serine/threonine protein kinase/sugar lactone lactonase YvrE
MLEPGAILQDRYKVVAPIGKGGMGSVYHARDLRLRTDVALKETLFSDEAYRQAFEHEAQILARLRHQHLPRVIDHFAERGGQFLVMEFIHGEDLGNQLVRLGQRFATPQAMPMILRWTDQLLDALHYLHSRPSPVYHRDIKPKNLKYTPSFEIVLLDFGLARGGMTVTVDPAAATAAPGEARKVYGFTPPYAPIEQMRDGEPDARSDLYSLAATIYHLLTASLPPDAMVRMAKLINGQPDPLRPIRALAPHVSEPVAELLQRALAVTIDGRPASAREMRDELARLRGAGAPARPAPNAEPAEQPREAERGGSPPLDTPQPPPSEPGPRSPAPPPAGPAPGAITPNISRASAATTPAGTLLRMLTTGSPIRSLAFSPSGERLAAGYDDHTVGLFRMGDYQHLATLKGHTSSVRCVRFDPAGGSLATGSDDETVRIWRVADGGFQRQLRVPACSVESLAFSPDGSTLAVGGWGKGITLCDARGGQLSVLDTLAAPFLHSLAFSPDGALLAAGGYDGAVYLWQVADQHPEPALPGFLNVIYAVAFSPDGAWLAASSGSSVRIWRMQDQRPVELLQGHAGPVHSLAFSPDGRTLATASEDKTARLWNISDWTPLPTPLDHRAGVSSLAFSPDGATLATGSHDGRIYLWTVVG